jgi:prepilin-type N-terminal cleavage/methylation domain-containing protein
MKNKTFRGERCIFLAAERTTVNATHLIRAIKQQRLPHQRGVTLIELLVAVAIGLVILAAIGYVYLTGTQGYRVQDAQSRVQEDARFTIDTLSNDIKMAGYFGCTAPKSPQKPRQLRIGDAGATKNPDQVQIETIARQPIMTLDTTWLMLSGKDNDPINRFLNPSYVLRVIRSADANTHPALPVGVRTNRLPGSDVLLILKAGIDAQRVIAPISAGAGQELSAIVGFTSPALVTGATNTAGFPLMVYSDCRTAKIIRPSRTVDSTGVTYLLDNGFNTNRLTPGEAPELNIQEGMDVGASVSVFEPVIYYLSNPTAAGQVPNLMRLGITDRAGPAGPAGIWNRNANAVVVAPGITAINYTFSVIPFNATPAAINNGTAIEERTLAQMVTDLDWYNVVSVGIQVTAAGDTNTSVTGTRLQQNYSFSAGLRARQGTSEYEQ